MDEREWTIMIYMAGDNNLAVDMAYALEQIKSIPRAGGKGPNLFVYYDGNSAAIPTMYCDFTDPDNPIYVRSFRVPNKLYDVPSKVNENAADQRSILNFVDWCLNGVPVVGADGEVTYGRKSKKHGLIFSGHSLGFQDKGLFRDESSGKSMKMDVLFNALGRTVADEKLLNDMARQNCVDEANLAAETKVLLGRKLDLLGFDSCVMGMLEIGYQFFDVADYMIVSEGSVPSAGWTYAKILGSLTSAESNGPAEVAVRFVRDFIRSQDAFTVGGVSVDMAAWDMSRFGPLVDAFDRLAEMLVLSLQTDPKLTYLMERALLNVHWKCQSYMFDQNVDLGDFCELLAEECSLLLRSEGDDFLPADDIGRMCIEVLNRLDEAVMLSGFSGGLYQYSNGVSVFFPWSYDAYAVSRKNYNSLFFAREAVSRKYFWSGFLDLYLGKIARRPAVEPGVTEAGRFRYRSGVPFADLAHPFSPESMLAAIESVKLGGVEGSKLGGVEGSKLGGVEGSKLGGVEGSKLGGVEGSKLGGVEGSKLGGVEGSKLGGVEGSKLGGVEGSKLGGVEGSKLGGVEGSKLGGVEGSKLGGVEGSKLGGVEGSKLGGVGQDKFMSSLRLFKNVEAKWDVSGFSKQPADD